MSSKTDKNKEKIDNKSGIDFEKIFEVRDSIFNLFKQDIAIELYEKNPFYVNKRIGHIKKDLKSIIINDSNLSFDMKIEDLDKEYFSDVEIKNIGEKRKIINIKFKCYFQEIYNFRIFFDDWGGENINCIFQNRADKKFKTKFEIKLLNLNSTTSSTQYNYMNE
jgi:hypothetical protein